MLLVCARGPDLVPRLSPMAAFGVPARRYPGLVYRVIGENFGFVIGCGLLSLRRRNGNRSRLGGRDLRRGSRVDRGQHVGRAPLITNAEVDWLSVAEQTRHAWLIAVGEDADRAGIMAVWMQLPFALLEIVERHTSVVLEQRTRMGEQEIANVREASTVQQIRRALHERIATAEPLAKSRQPALPEAIVRDVCAEIIERVLATVLVGEHDLGPVRGVGGNVG